jgi:hypothetical protein
VVHATMKERALAVRAQLEAHEVAVHGRPWSLSDLALGLVGGRSRAGRGARSRPSCLHI